MLTVDIDVQTRHDGFWIICLSEDEDGLECFEEGPYPSFKEAETAGNALIRDIQTLNEAFTATRH